MKEPKEGHGIKTIRESTAARAPTVSTKRNRGGSSVISKHDDKTPEIVRVTRIMIKRKQAEDELQAIKASFHSVVNKNADAIIIVDQKGIIRFANPAVEAIFGRNSDEMVGELFGFPLVTGETTEVEIFRGHEDRIVAEMRVADAVWKGSTAYLATLRDITERKQMEKMKDQLVSSTLHDLRTPLTAIKGYLGLLRDGAFGDLSEEQVRVIRTLADVTREMAVIINALLDLNKMKSGRYVLSIEPLNLKNLVAEVLEELRPIAEVKGLTLTKAFGLDSFVIKSDRRGLWQIVSNLVGNAIKFTDHGSVKVSVDSLTGDPASRGRMVRIRVEDTGCGIKAHHLEKIFDEFYQVEVSGDNTTPSTGLGLAICKRLVELLKGEINVESKPKRGTTFSVTLPEDGDLVTEYSKLARIESRTGLEKKAGN
ncbi:MAG: sensor histidine kinase [Candidatus Binatia bacterium]